MRERAELTRAIEHPGRTLVVGPAGIGKTALIDAALRDAQRAVRRGGGLALHSATPYLALSRALRRDWGSADPALVAEQVTTSVGEEILVLDDAQWLDTGTLDVLSIVEERLRIVVGVRTGDPGADETLRRLQPRARILHIDPLADGDATELARALRPDSDEADIARAVENARGTPLLLQNSGGDAAAPLAVIFRARLDRLSEDALEAAARLVLAGGPVKTSLLGAGAGELVAAGLAFTKAGATRPSHHALTDAVLEGVSPARRAVVHRTLAHLAHDPAVAAHHRDGAGDRRTAHRAAQRAARGEQHLTRRARLLQIAARSAPAASVIEDTLAAAHALCEAGEHRDALQVLASINDERADVSARIALLRARAQRGGGDVTGARATITAAEPAAGSHPELLAALRVERARTLLLDWDASGALAIVSPLLDDHALPGGLRAAGLFVLARAHDIQFSPACLTLYEDAIALARTADERKLELELTAAFAHALQAFGHPDRAATIATDAIAGAQRRGASQAALELRYVVAHLDLGRGAYDAMSAQCLALLDEPGLGLWRARIQSNLVIVAADRGRDGDAQDILAGALDCTDTVDGRAALLWARAEAHWLAGRPANAAADARACLQINPAWATLADVTLGWAAVDLGQPAPAPLQGPAYPIVMAAQSESRALAELAADPARATRSFERAAREGAQGYRRCELRCWWAAGEAARRAGELPRARALLLAVEQRAQQHGLVPLLGRIRRSLRAAGVMRSASRGSRRGPLTRREQAVLERVATGATSREIAAELGLAAATVDSHVRSAMRKLGVSSRRQAALIAASADENA